MIDAKIATSLRNKISANRVNAKLLFVAVRLLLLSVGHVASTSMTNNNNNNNDNNNNNNNNNTNNNRNDENGSDNDFI